MLSKFNLPIPLEYFSVALPTKLPGESLIILLAMFLSALLIIETLSPHTKQAAEQLHRSYKANIGLFIFNSVVMSLLSVSSLLMLAEHFSDQGLLRNLTNPFGKALLSFLLLDLLLYAWHKTCHSFDSLWMFHRVHHNDPALNVSTAFRVHIMELLLTTVLKGVYIIVLGINAATVLSYELVITFFVMFHHCNISFKGERLLGALLIVPAMHRTHHSVLRSEHDSNYGAVFSLWDRLFGTLSAVKPKKVGIRGESPEDLLGLIKFGFVTPVTTPATTTTAVTTSTPVATPVVLPADLDFMIKEAAYYKAEKRNFRPGYEMNDWLEAKKEIIRMFYADKSRSVTQQAKPPQPVQQYFKFMGSQMNNHLNHQV